MFKFFVDHTFLSILFVFTIWLTIHLTVYYWRKYNWAWGILVLFACCAVTPFLVYLVHKLIDV